MPPSVADLGEIGQQLIEPVILGDFLQHLAVADHRVQRCAQLMAHIGEESRFVLARRFELFVELAQLLAGAVNVGGERAELVAVGDADALGEIALGDPAQPSLDLAERADQRPGNRAPEQQRQTDAADREQDHPQLGGAVGLVAGVDPGHHVGFGLVDQLISQPLQAVRQRLRLLVLGLARLIEAAMPDQLDHLLHDRDKAVIFMLDPAEQLDLVLGDILQPLQVVAELVELAHRAVERAVVGNQQRRGDAVELAHRVLLDLAIGADLAFQPNEIRGPLVDPGQHLQSDRADRDQQHDDG